MSLKQLSIAHCRNLTDLQLTFSTQFNILLGPNGAGKTTVLEAIHLLCVGKSFRVNTIAPLIQYHQPECILFAEFANETRVGLRKTRQGKTELRVNQENQPSLAAFAQQQPVQVIDNQRFELIDGAPEARRQFLDWGLFHVEPSFYPLWQKYRRVLVQRNRLLRQQASNTELASWDQQLAELGEAIHQLRQDYLLRLTPQFEQYWQSWLPELAVTLHYHPGWPPAESLATHLTNTREADRHRAHTQAGPHRADLKLTCNHTPIKDTYSRGQKKMLLCALLLSQGRDLYQTTNKPCIYLIDDIAAELDGQRRQQVADTLKAINAQVFITGVEQALLLPFAETEAKIIELL